MTFVLQARAELVPSLSTAGLTADLACFEATILIRQGFEVVDIESDPVWRTTHMQRRL
ncbi:MULTISPECIES: hypothetical protein [Pseudomonas]|uniref:hypothetical protein n=1 Tax=Pseudomonas TaxID=286 RepID=UPI000AD8355F|nr:MULTISPECIES: hypothetical protein [Pseudomonas]MDN6861811.1 hypothetical protein [Pseudomonas rhodesiae]